MTLDSFPPGPAVSHPPLGKPFLKRLSGLILSSHLWIVPQLPAPATSHYEKGCKDQPGAAAFLRDRLIHPCQCSADMEPINFLEDLPVIRFSCSSCHSIALVNIEDLRSGLGWGKSKVLTGG